VALVLPGQINDKGWNENGFNALKAIKDHYGAETFYSESTQMVNWERVIRGFGDDGCDVILLHGLEFQDAALKYAKEYPKTIFLVSNGGAQNGTNCFSLDIKSPESAFLTGLLAGLQPDVKKASALVAFEYPLLVTQAEAFRYGFRCANPASASDITVIGTFNDTVVAKEAALAKIDAGTQVIWQLADTAGLGIIQAASDKNVWVIGWGIDQSPLAPNVVMTTQKVDLSYAMMDTVGDIIKGTFKPGSRAYGVESPATGLGPVNAKISAESVATVEKWREAIASGKVRIPDQIKMGESQTLPLLTLP
jgi:basic membrane protein A